ncbi:hemin uptake protein HemP [Rhodobacter maris]|uniref:hemin uptake protein HemP n=1 Tax=Rhodobacter maris TaxID=446682 RepID=UPI00374421FB
MTLRPAAVAAPPPEADEIGAARCPEVPRHDARALTCSAGLAHIVLDGVAYTLRITRNGKLILTK